MLVGFRLWHIPNPVTGAPHPIWIKVRPERTDGRYRYGIASKLGLCQDGLILELPTNEQMNHFRLSRGGSCVVDRARFRYRDAYSYRLYAQLSKMITHAVGSANPV